jgi:nucleoside-diphosphate-sugar epimerase
MRITVCGAGGAIGGHLVRRLLTQGHDVLAVDKKPYDEWWQVYEEARNIQLDLGHRPFANAAVVGADQVYNLAADMGGMGFIANHRVDCMNSAEITINVLRASAEHGVDRYLHASSACVYPDFMQHVTDVSLKEDDAWPADPEPGYGLEKLYAEQMCKFYQEETDLITRVPRFHNVYGPYGTYTGGREKAPAAICRKVIEAKLSGNHEIDIWGDGEQTRSFMWVGDCVEGAIKIMNSHYHEPINLGSSELVSINQLVDLVEDIAEIKVKRNYDLTKPQGVRGRNSDNTRIKQVFNWEPSTPLKVGIQQTYQWIFDELAR